jgi:hypothetical protein
MLEKKTCIRLEHLHGKQYDIVLNYDDATVEVISEAAIQLIQRHRMNDGDTLTIITADVEV